MFNDGVVTTAVDESS